MAATSDGDDLQPRLLRCADGHLVTLPVARWAGPVDAADESLLARVAGSVLDVGCGPGRLTVALHERGIDVLGLELVASIPVLVQRIGAPLHLGDVFGPVPRAGTWDSILLADGNIGIGGDPDRLLRRVADLLAPHGQVLLELHPGPLLPPGPVRLEGLGVTSSWFRWSLLGGADVAPVARGAGLRVRERWASGGREFVSLSAL